MTDAEVIRAAVAASGLSTREFAYEIMAGRDERTVRRWLLGETMPPKVRAWLEAWLAERR